MVRAGEGASTEANTVDAVQSALEASLRDAETDSADLVFLFASSHHSGYVDSMLERAVETAGTEAIVGCSGFGVITGEGENETEPGIAALSLTGGSLDALPFLVSGEHAGTEIGEMIGPNLTETSVLMLLPDIHYHPTALMAEIQETAGNVPVLGALASGNGLDSQTTQWCGRRISHQGVAGVLLSGVKFDTGVAQGCQPFGQAYTVTKAEGGRIFEIAFGPPIEALREAMDTLQREQQEQVGRNLFIGLAMDEYATDRGRGDFLVRNLGIDQESGAFVVGEQVEVGQTIQFNFRTPEAAHDDIERVASDLALRTGGSKKFGLYFNCMGRGFHLYGRPNHDVEIIRKHLGDFPVAGLFGNAEFAPVGGKNFVHSYTGALILFTEA